MRRVNLADRALITVIFSMTLAPVIVHASKADEGLKATQEACKSMTDPTQGENPDDSGVHNSFNADGSLATKTSVAQAKLAGKCHAMKMACKKKASSAAKTATGKKTAKGDAVAKKMKSISSACDQLDHQTPGDTAKKNDDAAQKAQAGAATTSGGGGSGGGGMPSPPSSGDDQPKPPADKQAQDNQAGKPCGSDNPSCPGAKPPAPWDKQPGGSFQTADKSANKSSSSPAVSEQSPSYRGGDGPQKVANSSVPNGGGGGGMGGGGASAAGGILSGARAAANATEGPNVMHGTGGGGGYSQVNQAMSMDTGGGDGYSASGGRAPASEPKLADLKAFLPGGKLDPQRLAGGQTPPSEIQGSHANLWIQMSRVLRTHCASGLLRDCGP